MEELEALVSETFDVFLVKLVCDEGAERGSVAIMSRGLFIPVALTEGFSVVLVFLVDRCGSEFIFTGGGFGGRDAVNDFLEAADEEREGGSDFFLFKRGDIF